MNDRTRAPGYIAHNRKYGQLTKINVVKLIALEGTKSTASILRMSMKSRDIRCDGPRTKRVEYQGVDHGVVPTVQVEWISDFAH